ncbi:MAG: PadR family transcriptional regulator [Cellulomonas sp.]|nr:PadR family transcriptional regulator [Cellulomonas sp.]
MSGRIRQTELAVLGALSVEPATGYAVREAIRDVLGHFWSESFGQIYPTLSELERQGHIQRSGGTRAGSSVFALTESGMTRFRELLGEPVQTALPRNGALLRLFFGRTVGREGCRELLLGAQSDAERRLVEFEAVAREMSADEAHAPDLPFWQLTVSAGQHTARATAAWATQALAALDVLPASAFTEQEERA